MSAAVPVIHIVDDDESVRTAIGRLLRTAGYQVSVYESAKELLEKLPAAVRGCILLDVQMPGLSGPQLQEILGKMGFELPIIFLSGHGDIPISVRAIKAGAEDFLSKPAPKKLLFEAIERALKRYDETHERYVRLSAFRELFSTLTPREREVFNLVVRGNSTSRLRTISELRSEPSKHTAIASCKNLRSNHLPSSCRLRRNSD